MYQDRFVTLNGLRIHYLDWGSVGKPPLIMLHGIGRVAHSFDHIAPHFRDSYHVIAMDLRGHGDSAPEAMPLHDDATTKEVIIRVKAGDSPALLRRKKLFYRRVALLVQISCDPLPIEPINLLGCGFQVAPQLADSRDPDHAFATFREACASVLHPSGSPTMRRRCGPHDDRG